jgi:D-alanyl-D-alanine carboxypeptidase/D-alanyl-D-alanine-endopeptidase (penicillin-binding protein 4)
MVLGLFGTYPAEAAGCSANKALSSKYLKTLHAEVVDLGTGSVLLSKDSEVPARTASVMKVLTAAVALDVLGPDYRVTTKVYADPNSPGKIFLVGAGDVTLSRMPLGTTSYYANGPKLDDLSQQVNAWATANGIAVTEVGLDSTLFGVNEDWHPTWSKRGLSDGYMAPVSALQIDGARLTASKESLRWVAKRTDRPLKQAGQLFTSSLIKAGQLEAKKYAKSVLPTGAIEIASVTSEPMSFWIYNMLKVSDNTLAEALARLSSIKYGLDGSMDSLTQLYSEVLSARGISVAGLKIIDGSGLSRDNAVAAATVNDVLVAVHGGVGDYSVLHQGLPVSGKYGSLRYRLSSGATKAAAGKVVAKTGLITTGYTLAGFVKAKDGSNLAFTVYNLNKTVGYNNRQALDNLVYRFYQCGAKLTN